MKITPTKILKAATVGIFVLSLLGSVVYSYFGIFDIPNRTNATIEEVDHLFWLLFIIWTAIAVFFFFIFTFLPIHKEYKVIGIRSGLLVAGAWSLITSNFALIVISIYYDTVYPLWLRYILISIELILQTCLLLQFILLLTLKMPNLLHRIFIAWPSAIQFSSIFLSLFFIVILPAICWVPYCSILIIIPTILSIVGLYQTTYTPKNIDQWDYAIIQDPYEIDYSSVSRIKLNKIKFSQAKERLNNEQKKIRIVQITDPHLGTMTSVNRLQTICKQALESNPDIIFLTGDFFNVEAYSTDEQALYNALLPLKQVANRTFACLGNHDHEHCARDITENTLSKLGIKLLVEDHVEVETVHGIVQVIGLDFVLPFPSLLEKNVTDVCKNIPRIANSCLRIVLLHDPSGFEYIPKEDQCLVFSGHTHGGQVGLISFGINLSIINASSSIPDQGFFGHGKNRLYVNRAQGCRTVLGTQLVRLGVPPEFIVLDLAV